MVWNWPYLFNLISNKETLSLVRSAPVMGVSCITGSRKRRKTYFTENEGHLCCAMWPTLGGGENWRFFASFWQEKSDIDKGGSASSAVCFVFLSMATFTFHGKCPSVVTILWGDAVIDWELRGWNWQKKLSLKFGNVFWSSCEMWQLPWILKLSSILWTRPWLTDTCVVTQVLAEETGWNLPIVHIFGQALLRKQFLLLVKVRIIACWTIWRNNYFG